MSKTLVLIHGRATKPRRAEKEALARRALVHGVARVDAEAARRLEAGEIRVEFVYYGDINNRILRERDPEVARGLEQDENGEWCEPPGQYDADLQRLLDRPTDAFTRDAYRELVRRVPDRRFMDEAARIADAILPTGLTRRLILRETPDLALYVMSRKVGSEIRERLQEKLRPALLRGDDVALVSHSMGCIASYDVLWKLSHMSEYRELHGRAVSLWLTLGSPLGSGAVKACLYDSNEPADGRYPRNVREWINVAAYDDFVAYDATAEDDFRGMAELGCRIRDLPRIFTFWCGRAGTNPHKLYGYLDHPVVGEQVARWARSKILAPPMAPVTDAVPA